jgi:hypothetical protein
MQAEEKALGRCERRDETNRGGNEVASLRPKVPALALLELPLLGVCATSIKRKKKKKISLRTTYNNSSETIYLILSYIV